MSSKPRKSTYSYLKLTDEEGLILFNAVEYLVEEFEDLYVGRRGGFVSSDLVVLEDILDKLEDEFPP